MNSTNNLNPKTMATLTEENIKVLSKKTKSQLIDIISRKDDKEEKFRETIEKLESSELELTQKVNDLECESIDNKKRIEDLINSLKESDVCIAELKSINEKLDCENKSLSNTLKLNNQEHKDVVDNITTDYINVTNNYKNISNYFVISVLINIFLILVLMIVLFL